MNRYIRIIAAAATIAWMIVIFSYSAQTGGESSATSSSVSYKVVQATDRVLGLGWQDERILQVADDIEEGIRKLAHMIEYAVLALLMMISLDVWKNPYRHVIRIMAVIIICTVYAASDEIHQLYVPGRHGCVRDVFIDAAGAAAAVIISELISRLRRK